MNGKEILVDTNIILYLLKGNDAVAASLQGKYIYISFITELELLGYRSITQEHEAEILELLKDCSIIQMSNAIKQQYIKLTRTYKIKLPDALIASTALVFDMPMISSDDGFEKIIDLKLLLYRH